MNKWTYYNNQDWHKYNLMTNMRNIAEIISVGKHDFLCDYGVQPNRITLGVDVFEQLCLECGIKNPLPNQRIKELLITVDERDPNKIELEYDESLAPITCSTSLEKLSSFSLGGFVKSSYDEDFELIAGENILENQPVVTMTYGTNTDFNGVAGKCGIMEPPGINSVKW